MGITAKEETLLKKLLECYDDIRDMSYKQFATEYGFDKIEFNQLLNKIGYSSYTTFQQSLSYDDGDSSACIAFDRLLMIVKMNEEFDNLIIEEWIDRNYLDLYYIALDLIEYDNTLLGLYVKEKLFYILHLMTKYFSTGILVEDYNYILSIPSRGAL